MITAQETMMTVFLCTNGAILINWLTPGEKFNSGYLCKKVLEELSETLYSGRAARSPRSIVHFNNATLHWPAAIEIAFHFANSDMLRSHPTAEISVRVTSFYSVI
jgi:hypothetical protein